MRATAKQARIIACPTAELPRAARLAARAWPVRPTPEAVLGRLKRLDSITIVAVPEDDLQPIMGVTTATIKGSVTFCQETVVATPFERCGLGTALLQGLMNHLSLRGVSIVMAQLTLQNVDFVKRFGFDVMAIETAEDVEGFHDGTTLVTMRYMLRR